MHNSDNDGAVEIIATVWFTFLIVTFIVIVCGAAKDHDTAKAEHDKESSLQQEVDKLESDRHELMMENIRLQIENRQ